MAGWIVLFKLPKAVEKLAGRSKNLDCFAARKSATENAMHSFIKALRLTARHYYAITAIACTSAVIALLWGANIGTLYPMVEIVFKGDSIPEYVDQSILDNRSEIERLTTERVRLQARLSSQSELNQANDSAAKRIRLDLQTNATMMQISQKSLASYQAAKPWADAYLPTTPYQTLVLIVSILVLGTAIKLVALGSNLLLVQYVAERTCMNLRAIYFRKALHLDLDSFGENGSADLTSRLTNDAGAVCGGIGTLLGRMIREPLKMIVCVGGALFICSRLLLLVLIVTPLMVVVMNYLSKAIRRASRRAMEEMSQLYGMLTDAFAGIRVVKAFNTQAHQRAKFAERTNAFYRKSMKMAFYNMLARSTSELLGMCTVGLAILGGGYLVINGETHLMGIRMSYQPLSVGQMLAFFGFLIGASDPARKLSDVWTGLQRGIAAAERVYQIIEAPIRVTEPTNAQTVPRPHKMIQLSGVTYQYSSGPVVLKEFDLKIQHGETVAVVGPNGSGKSTLVNLLCRFDDPQSGTICLDDVPLSQMRTRDLRRRIALVTQQTVLFDDTIENNIRYGTPAPILMLSSVPPNSPTLTNLSFTKRPMATKLALAPAACDFPAARCNGCHWHVPFCGTQTF